MRGYHCPTCQQVRGDRSYCAPLRCLCGHPACPAYASYVELSATQPTITIPQATDTTWATREEDTWIDKL